MGPALASALRAAPDRFRLELGYSIGLRSAEEATDPSLEKVSAELKQLGIEPPTGMVDVLLPMVELWAALRTFAKYQDNYYQHDTELVGLRVKLVLLAIAAPELWAQSLSWILARASELGDVAQAITLELASSAPEVRAALDDACNHEVEEVRLKAAGLRTLLSGWKMRSRVWLELWRTPPHTTWTARLSFRTRSNPCRIRGSVLPASSRR